MVGSSPSLSHRFRRHARLLVLAVALCLLACVAALDKFLMFAVGNAGTSRSSVRSLSIRYGMHVPPASMVLAREMPKFHVARPGGIAASLVVAAGISSLLVLRRDRWQSDLGKVPATVRLGQMQPSLPDAGIALEEKVDRKQQMKEQFDKEKWWRVLLHNDDIHTFEYVTGCLTRVVKHLTRRKAYNITWEAHSSGKATVACVWKSLAEQFCVNLQQLGLTVSIAPDSKFQGNKGGQ
mmetsp:Transcript_97258/g.270635  ORF Transcript_97258/g.270635 Transcript_97258/m.270635 type:complete len:237 (+) Transcript_97258:71-781(+)|eukprot:CAMPEP_0179099974 /NCGR_PEP_ID=MMETSP0796-20121207/46144_1 /TAXON_ID=73915 /ORGANISM="Pyrodinium bahamense, Strain pbaha01" /LENGTH=236 /DNA_ID=CAMNT_0020797777 /DNA_START=59 /DNA_END=769 /DNA_ORIENTATION=+